jgi:hypothetical protein
MTECTPESSCCYSVCVLCAPYHVHVVEVLEQRLRDRAAEPEQPLSQRRGGGRQPLTPGLRFIGTAHAQRGRAALCSALASCTAVGSVLVRSLKETMLEDDCIQYFNNKLTVAIYFFVLEKPEYFKST